MRGIFAAHYAFVLHGMTVRSSQRPSWLVWLPLGGAVLLTVGFLLGLGLQRQPGPLLRLADDEQMAPNALGVGSVEEILRYIEAKYVDGVEREALVDDAIDGLLAQLDPYSAYISPKDLVNHRARLNGTVEGAGIELAMVRDSVTVLSVLPGSPAAEAGVKTYDRVLSIADSAVSGVAQDIDAVQDLLVSLPKGSVDVALFRPGAGTLPPVSLLRRTLTVPTVGEGTLLPNGVAYIPVYQFADSTYEQFMTQVEELVARQGARHLILDLRGNSGGYLQEAVQMLSQFFPDAGTLLVYTEGEHSARKEYKSTGRVFFPVDGLIVLIDGRSASASEIVAAAVQDWDRGTIVGQPSFGKGLVQEMFPLKDRGALHLTVSRYYTPSGRSIQRDYRKGASRSPPASAFAKTSRPNASAALGEELPTFKTARGRPVYGGSGVTPDELVALDSVQRQRAQPSVRRVARELQLEFSEPNSPLQGFAPDALASEINERLTAAGAVTTRTSATLLAAALAAELRLGASETEKQRKVRELQVDPFVVEALRVLRKQ